MGTFDSFSIGTSGLHAAQRGVETAGQNIANINTKGYSRQRVELTPDPGPVAASMFSTYTGGGRGVASVEVSRLRDAFLDRRAREEQGVGNYLDELKTTYASVEGAFGEPSDTGLAAVMQDFLAAFDDVANQPTDSPARVQAIEKGVTLATNINSLRTQIQAVGDVAVSKLDNMAAEVNSTADQIAKIQFTLRSAQASGLNVNTLVDQRDILVKKVTDQVGGRVQHEADGTVTLFLGSRALVRGDRVDPLQVEETGTAIDVQWAADGSSAHVEARAKALKESVNTVIPNQIKGLDDTAAALVADINAQHTAGFDRNGDPGLDFFVTGLNGLTVNAAIRDDPDLIAASDTAGTVSGANALAMAEKTGAVNIYREAIVGLGVNSQAAIRRSELQQAVVEQVDLENEAVHGVNLDEELTDMIRFQRAYEANSRFINVVDSLLDVLVNRTGA